MSDNEKPDVERFAEVTEKLIIAISKLDRPQQGSQDYSPRPVTIENVAFWIVVVACAVMFTIAMTIGPRISTVDHRLEKVEDYINTLYREGTIEEKKPIIKKD